MQKRDFLKACTALAGLSLAGCSTRKGTTPPIAASKAPPPAARPPVDFDDASIWSGLFSRMPPDLAALAKRPEHEVQIVYTPIRRVDGVVQLPRTYTWRIAPQRWFAGMSLAKMPIALLAAETLGQYNMGFDTSIALDAQPATGEWPAREPAAETFGRSLRRIFAVSDNAPFNRLYDFLGPDAMNARLADLGYPNSRLISRLGSPADGDQRLTRSGALLRSDGQVLQRWPPRLGRAAGFPFGRALQGKAWQQDDGTVIQGPHDFSQTNYLPLQDLHDMVMALMFPNFVPQQKRWALTPAVRGFMQEAMQSLPRQSRNPVYPERDFPDSYANYFVIGGSATRKPDTLTLIGKGGFAFGYMGDVRYLRDSVSGGEALLAAVIYANADGVLNDSKYEYESVSLPFMVHLGQAALVHSRSLMA